MEFLHSFLRHQGAQATTTVMATKMLLKKRIHAPSNFMALIPSLVQMGFHQGGCLREWLQGELQLKCIAS